MKKLLFVIGLMMVMVGCNNPLKKSISEELTMEEVKSISKKDPLFLAFYDRYFENRCYEGFLKDKTMQVMYSDITYKRFYEYIKQVNGDDFINAVYEDAENNWYEEFGYIEQKFDSIINYWQDYIHENAPYTYLDVEFDHAVSCNTNYEKCMKLYFKLTPKRGKIQSALFKYTIKTNDGERKNMISDQASQFNAFSDPIIIEDCLFGIYSSNYFYKDVAENKLSNEELKENYTFDFKIENVKTEKDGNISMSKLYLDMPVEVELYIREPYDRGKSEIVKHYIDKNYISLDEYKTIIRNMKMKEIDPMCYNFQEFIVGCKNALK